MAVLMIYSIMLSVGIYPFIRYSVFSDILLMNCQAINITGSFY